ncbi:MAG: DUF1722 domain-containing protein [Desulfobacterales bacterium]|nr:DUF1722 domain-containing protein [Desulfobacterales bacterium]MDX2509832.1 DUF1722 domain-containing protein [Desulfobacterales bacterium]
MRIWDVSPGYLNRQSLLGEHRELHGIVSIIRNNKKGYSKHPETLRWVGHGWALKQRHKLIVAEMNLRGYIDRSPVTLRSKKYLWPPVFIDSPASQLSILSKKYEMREPGRIPLPQNAQQLWAQHKYSAMARNITAYKDIGKWVTSKHGLKAMHDVALELATLLKTPPNPKLIRNSVLHMWGYVSEYSETTKEYIDSIPTKKVLKKIQHLALSNNSRYLIDSTALSELCAWTD